MGELGMREVDMEDEEEGEERERNKEERRRDRKINSFEGFWTSLSERGRKRGDCTLV